jgi:hypothetical protein
LVHVTSGAAIFKLALWWRSVCLHYTATCRILFTALVTCLPTYRTMARYFEFLSQFYGFHLTHPRMYGSQTSWFWRDSTDFESCVPCPAWIRGGTHIGTAFRNLRITLINRSQDFSALVALCFRTYNSALIFDTTIVKNNITRMMCCGFVVLNRRRSVGDTIILSKILAQS